VKEAFIDRQFKQSSLDLIEAANEIIEDYQQQGFTLTLRQLYYQFVSRDLIPNKQTEYKRLGSVINDARLAGLIDWDAIEDRTRNVRTHSSWDDPADIINSAAQGYRENLWLGQDYRPEIWIEKDALIGVIEPICRRYRIPYFACRGYSSQSEQYSSGRRFAYQLRNGLKPIVFHLGDHDPSGIDMTRDNADRLSMFAGEDIEVRRLALNWDQIERYRPPPNPAKDTDSRSTGYVSRFGNSSWELDALDPRTIDGLIEAEIETIIDREAWSQALEEEEANRNSLIAVSDHWDDVQEYIANIEG
jgi:hypothetical protein